MSLLSGASLWRVLTLATLPLPVPFSCSSFWHQTNTHPRTVVALVEDNPDHEGCDKCMLITIDGRQAMGVGMSAAQVTEFIMLHFPNIKYALNMDGGGSTCMCIIDRGNNQNVVNHPIDGGVIDQVRSVNSHFYITYDETDPNAGGGNQ